MGSLNRNIMPCAACKILRRRCTNNCIFFPYFSPAEPEKFAAVHRIFGASNISKLLQEIPVNDRDDAVISMVYEAMARLKDPVYGCVGLIASLQKHVFQLQSELDTAIGEVLTLRTQLSCISSPGLTMSPRTHIPGGGGGRGGDGSGRGGAMEQKNLYNLHQPHLLNDCYNSTDPIDAMLLLEPSSQQTSEDFP